MWDCSAIEGKTGKREKALASASARAPPDEGGDTTRSGATGIAAIERREIDGERGEALAAAAWDGAGARVGAGARAGAGAMGRRAAGGEAAALLLLGAGAGPARWGGGGDEGRACLTGLVADDTEFGVYECRGDGVGSCSKGLPRAWRRTFAAVTLPLRTASSRAVAPNLSIRSTLSDRETR